MLNLHGEKTTTQDVNCEVRKMNEQIIAVAIQNTILGLTNEPNNLKAFINDVRMGKEKQWREYRMEIWRLKENSFNGRPVPQRMSRPRAREEGCKLDNRHRVVCPQLWLHKEKTLKGRIKMILNSGADKAVIKDLLTHQMASFKAKRGAF